MIYYNIQLIENKKSFYSFNL